MSEQFRVSSEASCVKGHFPGQPIVPGAYLLAKVHQSFAARFPGKKMVSLRKVKFVAPITPEEAVFIVWDENAWPVCKVRLQVAGVTCLQATVQAA